MAGAEEDLCVSEEKHLIEEATHLISCHNEPTGFFFFFNLSGSYVAAVTREHFTRQMGKQHSRNSPYMVLG